MTQETRKYRVWSWTAATPLSTFSQELLVRFGIWVNKESLLWPQIMTFIQPSNKVSKVLRTICLWIFFSGWGHSRGLVGRERLLDGRLVQLDSRGSSCRGQTSLPRADQHPTGPSSRHSRLSPEGIAHLEWQRKLAQNWNVLVCRERQNCACSSKFFLQILPVCVPSSDSVSYSRLLSRMLDFNWFLFHVLGDTSFFPLSLCKPHSELEPQHDHISQFFSAWYFTAFGARHRFHWRASVLGGQGQRFCGVHFTEWKRQTDAICSERLAVLWDCPSSG